MRFFLFIFIVFISSCQREDIIDENKLNLKGQNFIDSLEISQGGFLSPSDLENKIIVLNIWADWCPPCIIEMPYFNKGIKQIHGVLHPNIKINIPLDTLFKLLHASQDYPLIKFNHSNRKEKIYRLYAYKTAKNGKKIKTPIKPVKVIGNHKFYKLR